MNILVTGGAGFIGSHIVEQLLHGGHHVAVLDDLSTGKKLNLPPEVPLYVMDLLDPAVDDVFAKEQPDAITHQAAATSVPKSIADPMGSAKTNILGTIALLRACERHRVKRVVFASTGGALYGATDALPSPETHATKPLSPYGVSKLAGEQYLFSFHRLTGIPVTILRYSNIFGPRQDRKGEGGVVMVFIKKMLLPESGELIINGDGLQTRDLLFVEDVAAANVLALSDMREGFRTYNVGTGVETSIVELFQHLAKELGYIVPSQHGPTLPGEIRRSCLDTHLLRQELGWSPKNDLPTNLRKTIAYARESFLSA